MLWCVGSMLWCVGSMLWCVGSMLWCVGSMYEIFAFMNVVCFVGRLSSGLYKAGNSE